MRSVDWLKRKSRDERSDHREPFTSTDEHAHARPLSDPERNILSALLETDFPGAAELRAQVSKTEVVGLCPCGCPNVILAVSPDVAPASLPDLSVDAELDTAEHLQAVVLSVRGGRPFALKTFWVDGGGAPSEWPSVD